MPGISGSSHFYSALGLFETKIELCYNPVSRALLISTLPLKKACIYSLYRRRKCRYFSDNFSYEKFTLSLLALCLKQVCRHHISSLVSEIYDSLNPVFLRIIFLFFTYPQYLQMFETLQCPSKVAEIRKARAPQRYSPVSRALLISTKSLNATTWHFY